MFKKVDRNQSAIVKALRDFGVSVEPRMAQLGKGAPDLVIGYRGVNHLFEVKDVGGKLTTDQKKWIAGWNGSVHVIDKAEDCVDIIFGKELGDHEKSARTANPHKKI